ncbi:response regulator, partial [Myxococcota bacterium]|nr:response regulator [Myxococcota bacterium]
MVLRTQLQFAGYVCHACAGGQDALATLKRVGPVDVILTDLRMPGMDGFTLLTRIRQLDPVLPVIILTAFGTVGNAVEAVKAGAFDYIEKPFDRDRLLQ